MLNLSEDVGIESKSDLKNIVPKAISIRIPHYCARNKILKTAFVEFETIDEAEENFANLKEIELPVGSLEVSRVTEEKNEVDVSIDPLRLYVTGIPEEAETSEIQELFPNATVNRNNTAKFRKRLDFKTFAVLTFKTQKEASEAFWSGKDIKIRGSKLLVLYSKNNVKSKLISDPVNAKKKKVKRLQKGNNLKNLGNEKQFRRFKGSTKGKLDKIKSFEENLIKT
ncbi:RRM domain-containing protein, partial [Armadillidium nasatum]